MENSILTNMGIDPAYLIILLFLVQILLFVLLININMKYTRLKSSYASFMRGKDGKTLENSFEDKFNELDEIAALVRQNRAHLREVRRMVQSNYQKVGIVKYDAFHEMGGNLSFALTMLDNNNNGWILNAMHSREGCYTYIKEVVKGQSYIELAEEEKESLERAVYQESYGLDIDDVEIVDPKSTLPNDIEVEEPMEEIIEDVERPSKKNTGSIPRTTGRIPRTTGQIPKTDGTVPRTTGKIPRMTGQIPKTDGTVPRTTGKIPRTTGQIPKTSGAVPRTTGKIPRTTGKIPRTTGNIPKN